jgi:tetratricopeptide (TPR) repeat protein
LSSRHNLANALQVQGKHAEAEKEHRAVLAIRERVLGAEHPDVFLSCYNLALCLEKQGRLEEALAFAKRAGEGWKRVLGEEHPNCKSAVEARQRIEAKLKGK